MFRSNFRSQHIISNVMTGISSDKVVTSTVKSIERMNSFMPVSEEFDLNIASDKDLLQPWECWHLKWSRYSHIG